MKAKENKKRRNISIISAEMLPASKKKKRQPPEKSRRTSPLEISREENKASKYFIEMLRKIIEKRLINENISAGVSEKWKYQWHRHEAYQKKWHLPGEISATEKKSKWSGIGEIDNQNRKNEARKKKKAFRNRNISKSKRPHEKWKWKKNEKWKSSSDSAYNQSSIISPEALRKYQPLPLSWNYEKHHQRKASEMALEKKIFPKAERKYTHPRK